jgi:hypothetical protein
VNFYLLQNQILSKKSTYLCQIFQLLGKINTSTQGKNENILTSTDNIRALKYKLNLEQKIEEGKFEIFPRTSDFMLKSDEQYLTCNYLSLLAAKSDQYFLSLKISECEWIRHLFTSIEMSGLSLS